MATNLPSGFSIEFLEQLLKLLVNFTLLKYVKSQRSHGFLITKELIFGFQMLDLKECFCSDDDIKNRSCCYKAVQSFFHFLIKSCLCTIFRQAMAIISVS